MTSIGTRELRAGLAEFVRRAEAGERFTVTVGNRPVARLGPVEPDLSQPSPSLEDLADLGLVERPRTAGPAGDQGRFGPDTEWDPARSFPIPADVRVDRILRQVRG